MIGVAATAFLFWTRKQLKPLLAGARPETAGGRSARQGRAGRGHRAVHPAVVGFGLVGQGRQDRGRHPAGLPPFALPSFDLGLWQQLLLPAVLISLVGFVESVSVAQTLAAKRRQRIVPNQELTALGASNIASALSGGYPVTGGFARSVVNFDAGAETPLAGAFTAAGILAATVFLTPLFRFLPQAVLAATIIVAVLSLVDIAAIRRTWAYSKADFAAMAVTILTVLLVGVEAGITAGVSLSLLLFLWRTSRPHMAIVGQVPGTEHFRNVDRHDVITDPAILSIRVDESLYFANARALEDAIYDRIADQPGSEERHPDVPGRERHRRQRARKPRSHRPPPRLRRRRVPSVRGQGPGDGRAEAIRLHGPFQGPHLPVAVRGRQHPVKRNPVNHQTFCTLEPAGCRQPSATVAGANDREWIRGVSEKMNGRLRFGKLPGQMARGKGH